MMRKISAILLALTIVFSLISCSKAKNTGGDGIIPPVPKDGKLEMTILVNSEDYNDIAADGWLAGYIAKFKRDFGVDIKFEEIEIKGYSLEDEDEYLKKLFVKLITKDGPDLIFNQDTNLVDLIEQQAAVDLRGKVANIDKIYDSLISDRVYYAPLGVMYWGMAIKTAAFTELKVPEPEYNWMPRDYNAFRSKWVSNNKILFNGYEYSWAFQKFIDLDGLYKDEEKKVVLNTAEVRQKIKDVRSYIFGGAYQLIDRYKYENYYNMLFELGSEEAKRDFEIRTNADFNPLNGALGGTNFFRAKTLHEHIKEYTFVKNPTNMPRSKLLYSYGFLVNKNGKHQDLAYEFINGLLSDEVQMGMFEYESDYYTYYPVNKEIEADIFKLEGEEELDPRAIQVKAFALQELKYGELMLSATTQTDIYKLEGMIYKDLAKLILADNPYSDEQLQVELKRMEDKYNIYLNE
jgi:ABC-type glycerol-3-phosphate transport system substrate-binding protein